MQSHLDGPWARQQPRCNLLPIVRKTEAAGPAPLTHMAITLVPPLDPATRFSQARRQTEPVTRDRHPSTRLRQGSRRPRLARKRTRAALSSLIRMATMAGILSDQAYRSLPSRIVVRKDRRTRLRPERSSCRS